MKRLLILVAVGLMTLSALSVLESGATGSAASVHYTSCKASAAPKYPLAGGSWSGFKAHGTTCQKSYSVAKWYAQCRLKHGDAGRCVVKVGGWACRETRQTDPTGAFSASVQCGKDAKIVLHHYRQPPPR